MLAASAVAAIAARLPTLFTAYRITPRNYSGLTNVNSGDAAGDVFFGLYEFALPIICAEQPSLINCENIPILSIPGFNIYTKSLVEADPRFSTYKGCNPDADSGVFHCEILGNHSACWYDSPQGESFSGLCDASSCRCDAFDAEAVGKDVCNMCSPNASWHPDTPIWRQVEALGQKLNGTWYSTQAEGECAPGGSVGSTCWWREVRQERNVNASCVNDRVVDAVQAAGAPCFAACGDDAANQTSSCWIGCLFSTLVGSMTKAQIIAPFERAFASDRPDEGGCEEVPPCPPPCEPPVPGSAGISAGHSLGAPRAHAPGSSRRSRATAERR